MFKRDMIICIRKAGTSDTPIVLPIVDDTIDITTKDISTSITDVNMTNPRFTELYVNRGKSESTLKFTTYIKPVDIAGVSLADSLLYESVLGYNIVDSQIASTTFGSGVFGSALIGNNILSSLSALSSSSLYLESVNTALLKSFDVFIIYKNGGTTFSLTDAVTVNAEFMFDIEGIARVKWTVSGVNYAPADTPNYSYPTNLDTYILNNWTQARIDFPPLNKSYNLASTKFTFTVRNTVTFPFVDQVSQKFNTASTTPVLEKRALSVKFSVYLRVFPFYNDLIDTIEHYSYMDNAMNFNAKIGPCNDELMELDITNATIKYPKIGLDDATTLDLDIRGEIASMLFKG